MLIRQWAKGLLARPRFQPLVEWVDDLCLEAMNIGGHATVEESGELQVLDRLAATSGERGPVVVDAGAHHGEYAEKVRLRIPESRLICLEPSRVAFEELEQRLGHHSGVELVNAGLGERQEDRPLYSDADGSPLSSLYRRRLDHFGIQMEESEVVPLLRLDTLCLERNIDRIDLLKLDVEGHELSVLRGAGDLVPARRIELIQFEFGGCNIDSRTFFQDLFYLLDPNYVIHRILPTGLVLIPAYREKHERFITTNFLAVARH